MKKRVLSLFLTFVLSFSMMPMSAFAEGTGAVAEQEAQSSGDTAYVSTTYNGISYQCIVRCNLDSSAEAPDGSYSISHSDVDRRPAGGGHSGECGRASGTADGY